MTTTAPVPIQPIDQKLDSQYPQRLPYGALITMMLMSFFLVTAEFLPSGMLTRIADGLNVTTGQAGQMVSVTAFAGLLAAPTIGVVFPRLDRRSLLVWMAVAAAVSNILVAIAPSLLLVIIARLLLGVAISGFWTMSIAVASRIAGPKRLGRAVMFNAAGVSLATMAGVPLGVMLGELVGWRGVFVVIAALSGLLAVLLRLLLPPVPAATSTQFSALFAALRHPGIGIGVVANMLVVAGHFLAYAYIRVALERVTDGGVAIHADTIVLLLAAFGLGGLIGNAVIGLIVDRRYRLLAVITPLIIAVLLLVVSTVSGSPWATGVAVFAWGFFFASWILIANTWVGHRLPHQLEAGGSLIVVGFQAGIVLAAAVGGVLVDALGIVPVFITGAALLLLGSLQFGISDTISARRGNA
ncbi:MFS transporter [Lysinibacter cavernae]|uniref:Putative MFS family arabinose efflux permease n=1 Tax=Lysinibacter cavernae TaxID=1640652 RepID=A0A7X5R1Y3_9MICO|nr:MFS transporter [Lysinibacter cavernae]NIH53900.1 putative MFS family arabinose efflux permease [Lysinibacter cavernae]